MPLSLELSYLYIDWHCNDGSFTKYSALLHFMNLWLWDGKDSSLFPLKMAEDFVKITKVQERDTRAIAISGIILLAMRHGDNCPGIIKDILTEWYDNEEVKSDLIEIQKYFLASTTGLKMQKKVQEELLGKMQKEQRILREKLGMVEDEDARAEIAEEGNRKLMSFANEINKIMQNGVDMNIGTFASLKGLDFFKVVKHWFLEFDINHPCLEELGEKKKLANALFNHAELCDLDKYALSSVITKAVSVEAMSQDLPQEILESMQGENAKNILKQERYRNAYKYAFQTFFRFFQFSPWHQEVLNPFKMTPFLSDYTLLSPLISNNFLLETSKIFISNSFYSHSAMYLRRWMMQNSQTDEALQLLAHCDKYLGENEERLQCLMELENRNPEDMELVKETGLCLIAMKRYEEAQKRFFQLEVTEHYLRGSARAIAWCSLMMKNVSRAQRYYKKLLAWEGGASWEDMVNAAHCAWVSGDPIEASRLYSLYLTKHNDNLSAFDNDYEVLRELGIPHDDISLMRDTIMQ